MGLLSQIGLFLGLGRQTTVATQSAPVVDTSKPTIPPLDKLEVVQEEPKKESKSTFVAAESKVSEGYRRRFPGC